MAWTRHSDWQQNKQKKAAKNSLKTAPKDSNLRKDIKYVKKNFTFSFLRFLICVVLLSAVGGAYYFTYTLGIFNSVKTTNSGAGGLNESAPKIVFHMIDVGCADSLFLQFPDGKTMMIDCGFSVNTKDEYKYSTIYTYLTETAGLQKGGKIDYIVNTHSDGDHYNGFVSLLRDFEIGEIWLPWVWTDGSDELNSPTYEDNSGFTTFIKKSIEEVGLAKVHAIKADELEDITNDGTFGDNDYDYRVRFISPTKQFINNHIDTPAKPDLYNNTVSAMMTLEFGNQIFVFTGDAEGIESGVADRKTEGEFISVVSQQYPTLFTSGKHVYLKVAHHGAKTKGSNSLEFLNFIKPEFAFISAGRDYNDAHPDPSVAERLADFCGENVYVTKDIGNITAAFDGNNIEINGVIKKTDPIKTISVSGAFIIAGIFVVIICFYKFDDGKTVSKKLKK